MVVVVVVVVVMEVVVVVFGPCLDRFDLRSWVHSESSDCETSVSWLSDLQENLSKIGPQVATPSWWEGSLQQLSYWSLPVHP